MKKICAILLGLGLLFMCTVASANTIDENIEQIIDWKKEEQGINTDEPLLQNPFLKQATSSAGDWYPFALGRIGYPDDYDAYLAIAENNLVARYESPQKLDATKATEWHRTSLAILAIGGDPTNIEGINLIADGTYNRAHTTSLGTQGLNGWIWGLITLDSMRYKIPDNAATTREEIIIEILQSQLPDGGFSLFNDTSDVDLTAMALQALAPYANSFQSFTYTQQTTNEKVTKTIRTVIEEALLFLSNVQSERGDFGSWGESNAESTAQVLVALSALNIDCTTDERFIKNGHTVLDGIMHYQQKDGGFIHSEKYNPENPTSLPDESNSMASEQVLYALIAHKRATEGYRALFDMRNEQSEDIRKKIDQIEQLILSADLGDTKQIKQIIQLYTEIPADEAMYIDHFEKLQQAVEENNINYTTPFFTKEIGVSTTGNGTITPLLTNNLQIAITPEDIAEFIQQSNFTTSDYNTALRYLRYAEKNNDETLRSKLKAILRDIEKIQTEIDELNELILQNVYPISSITLQDKEMVTDIQKRFLALHKSDQKQIVNFEDLQQLDAIISSLQREFWIKRLLIVTCIGLIGYFIWRVKKRRQGASL